MFNLKVNLMSACYWLVPLYNVQIKDKFRYASAVSTPKWLRATQKYLQRKQGHPSGTGNRGSHTVWLLVWSVRKPSHRKINFLFVSFVDSYQFKQIFYRLKFNLKIVPIQFKERAILNAILCFLTFFKIKNQFLALFLVHLKNIESTIFLSFLPSIHKCCYLVFSKWSLLKSSCSLWGQLFKKNDESFSCHWFEFEKYVLIFVW